MFYIFVCMWREILWSEVNNASERILSFPFICLVFEQILHLLVARYQTTGGDTDTAGAAIGQLILRKTVKLKLLPPDVIFQGLKCTEFDFVWGSVPDPAGGAHSWLDLSSPTSEGGMSKWGIVAAPITHGCRRSPPMTQTNAVHHAQTKRHVTWCPLHCVFRHRHLSNYLQAMVKAVTQC